MRNTIFALIIGVSFLARFDVACAATSPESTLPHSGNEAINETRAELFYSLGVESFNAQDYGQALDAFMNASQIKPHYKQVDEYIEMTKRKVVSRERETTIDQNTQIQKRQAYYVALLYNRALYDIRYERFAAAQAKLEKILALDPDHEGAATHLATLRLSAAVPQRTKIREKEVVAVPDSELAQWYLEGIDFFKHKWPQRAVERFEMIAARDSEYKDVQKWLVRTRLYLAQLEKKEKGEPYTLGADDIIEINIHDHPELSGRVVIEQGGEIIIPLIKEVVHADGLTKEELGIRLQQVLGQYIKDPDVSVVITGYNSKKWYILGEARYSGEYPLGKQRLTLMEALYRAGLPLERSAAMRGVFLIKPRETKPIRKKIDVAQILYEGKMKNNVYIEPGDIIYIPKTVASKVNAVFTHVLGPITGIKQVAEDSKGLSDAMRAMTPINTMFGPASRRGLADTNAN